MWPSDNLQNSTLADTCWRVQLVCKKVQAHSSLEPLIEYNKDKTPMVNQGTLGTFWNITQFKISSRQE